MTYDEYERECKRLFGAGRFGWSVWEEGVVRDEYERTPQRTPQEVVYLLNDYYARRRADRNA